MVVTSHSRALLEMWQSHLCVQEYREHSLMKDIHMLPTDPGYRCSWDQSFLTSS